MDSQGDTADAASQIPDSDGNIDNTATADSDQTGPETATEEVPLVFDPSIAVTKTAIDSDGDGLF